VQQVAADALIVEARLQEGEGVQQARETADGGLLAARGKADKLAADAASEVALSSAKLVEERFFEDEVRCEARALADGAVQRKRAARAPPSLGSCHSIGREPIATCSPSADMRMSRCPTGTTFSPW